MVMVFIVSLSRAASSATARESLATAMLSWLSRCTMRLDTYTKGLADPKAVGGGQVGNNYHVDLSAHSILHFRDFVCQRFKPYGRKRDAIQ